MIFLTCWRNSILERQPSPLLSQDLSSSVGLSARFMRDSTSLTTSGCCCRVSSTRASSASASSIAASSERACSARVLSCPTVSCTLAVSLVAVSLASCSRRRAGLSSLSSSVPLPSSSSSSKSAFISSSSACTPSERMCSWNSSRCSTPSPFESHDRSQSTARMFFLRSLSPSRTSSGWRAFISSSRWCSRSARSLCRCTIRLRSSIASFFAGSSAKPTLGLPSLSR
mmetsp:Transcript_74009/g.203745  ORF Transcript_74009/g.203745 Transcript_74009/m.203745 type:complete len:227 (+) Transcript_74009:1381-2061(+)